MKFLCAQSRSLRTRPTMHASARDSSSAQSPMRHGCMCAHDEANANLRRLRPQDTVVGAGIGAAAGAAITGDVGGAVGGGVVGGVIGNQIGRERQERRGY